MIIARQLPPYTVNGYEYVKDLTGDEKNLIIYAGERCYGINKDILDNAKKQFYNAWEDVENQENLDKEDREELTDILKYYDILDINTFSKAMETEENIYIIQATLGAEWQVLSVNGYSQGEYAYVYYNVNYIDDEGAETIGDLYLNNCDEFCLIDTDSNETIYGYFITHSKLWEKERENNVKQGLSYYFGEEIDKVEMISDSYTGYNYSEVV